MTIKFNLSNNRELKVDVDFSGKFNLNKFNESKTDKAKITKITVGKKVKDLDSKVFMDLKQLKEVNFKNSILTHYGYLTFKNCINLYKIIDSDSSTLVRLNNSTFRNTGLTKYKCPASLKHMNNYNFKDSIKLETVNLNNLETLGKENFKNCASLNEVTLSNKLEKIGFRSFENCHKLNTVKLNRTDKLKIIGQSAFYNCSGLKSIGLPKSIEIIDYSSFQNTGLTNIVIPLPIDSQKIIEIKSNAFKNCFDLEYIFLNEKTKLSNNSFKSIPEKANIYKYNKNNMSSLQEVRINGSEIEKIRDVNVFDENYNIIEIFKPFEKKLANHGLLLKVLKPVNIYGKSSNEYNSFVKNLNKPLIIHGYEFKVIKNNIYKSFSKFLKVGVYNITYGYKGYELKQVVEIHQNLLKITLKPDKYNNTSTILIRNQDLVNNKIVDPGINIEGRYATSYDSLLIYGNRNKNNNIFDLINNDYDFKKDTLISNFPVNYEVQKKNVNGRIVSSKVTRFVYILINANPTITSNITGDYNLKLNQIKDPKKDLIINNKITAFSSYNQYSVLFKKPFNLKKLEFTSNWDKVVKNKVGTYTVTYTAKDSLGETTKDITVNIISNVINKNTINGYNALNNQEVNAENVAIGSNALEKIQKSFRNCAIGENSMANSTGLSDSNTAVGYNSLLNAESYRNIGIGVNAGKNIGNGADNILIGTNSDVSKKNSTNQIVIGNFNKNDDKVDDNSILLNQQNILPGKKNTNLGDKEYKYNNIYSEKIVNGDLELTLPTNKLSGDRYLEVDDEGKIKFITLQEIISNL